MTDRERGFLDAILADPSDDFPRLIYADWLEDEGRLERAELIRVQCRLAVWLRGGVLDYDVELRRRERELLDTHWHDWSTPLTSADTDVCANLCDPDGRPSGLFRRGFVASVSLPLADFLTHAKAIFGAAPVEEVRLMDREPVLRYEGVCWVVPFGIGTLADCREPSNIPRALINALSVKDYNASILGNVVAFRHREDAMNWLSAVCVACGCAQAGLPALATPTEAVSR